MEPLERVLSAAIAAPGNRDRFADAGLIVQKGDQIHLVDDWQSAFLRLRPIAKETIRQSPGQFLATVDDIVYRGSTSASRGKYFVYFANGQWNQARVKARQSSLAWWGIDEQTPILNVGSRLLPVRPVDMAMVGELTSDFLDRLLHQLSVVPAVVRGYPSRLCEIASALIGREVPHVLAVICTGECLFDFQKALLERVFSAPVINEYGCQESGISGLTCPEAGRLHLDGDRCLFEVIDGQLVTTDLYNLVMPMVRYQCGDVLHLHPDSCPCGRSSPTAMLRGRVEDKIRTREGIKHPGSIEMPVFPGVLQYQMIRGQATQTMLRVCPDSTQLQLDLQPLRDWSRRVFGDGDVQVAIDPVLTRPTSIQHCEVQTWIDQITAGSWSALLNQPKFPEGEAQAVGELFYQLVNPATIMNDGLPTATWRLLHQVSQSNPANNKIEEISARILLFACSFLWSDSSVEGIYQKAVQRLKPLLKQQPQHPASLDCLIPTLFLETETGLRVWEEWLCDLDGDRSHEIIWQVDTFTFQHTLQALEAAVKRTWQHPSLMFRTLRPFLSVLIGDLSFFAPHFAPWLLGHWFELLHQKPLPQSKWLQPPEQNNFAQTWMRWRRQLMNAPQEASIDELNRMSQSPREREQCALEQGYGQIVQGKPLQPSDWLPILRQIGEPAETRIDLVPWQPILKALVKPLFMQGQFDLAYDCLRAVTVPSSRISAFERLAAQHNHKQNVLYDFFAQTNK